VKAAFPGRQSVKIGACPGLPAGWRQPTSGLRRMP
jgi:hypothetical protein